MPNFKGNKAKKIARFLLWITMFSVSFGVYNLARAEYNKLPEPMVGAVTIVQGTNTMYGGFTGNEAILNYDPNEPLLGFDQVRLITDPNSCYKVGIKIPSSPCFEFDQQNVFLGLMTARTYVNGSAATEVAALYLPNTIVGDAYSTGSYLDNFAFYGRNLSQSTTGSLGRGYTWSTAGYTLNPDAQASYSDDQKAYFDSRINLLYGEGQVIASATLFNATNGWYLQNDSIGAPGIKPKTWPEGKIWRVNSALNLTGDTKYKYYGKGTIIINNNFTLRPGTSIVPGDDNSFLGIIVRGNLIFGGRNKVQMANFTTGDISINGNYVEAIGSFAASQFDVDSYGGIRFFYDYRLDSGWPPGFRFFNMPTAQNTAP